MVGHPLRYGNLVVERHDFLIIKKYMQQHQGLKDYIHGNVSALLEENLQDAIIADEKNMSSEIARLYPIH